MADDFRGRGLPPRDYQEESQYPPPPGEEDDRSRPYHLPPPQMAAGPITLPSLAHDPYAQRPGRYAPPDHRGGDGGGRGDYSASPTSVNGYGPPPSGPGYLPPVQPPPEARSPYGNEQRDFYPPGQRVHAYGAEQRPPYGSEPYPPPYNGYRPPAQGYGAYDYRAGGAPAPAPQAAPRQRTSIACRYCRKRKIRCSGYQNTPDGKCTNCKKTGNDCVFQPVSSSSSTAFIPVSAVPGGVPPGTPLYGAFGQPLAPSGGGSADSGGHPGPPPGPYAPPPSSSSDYPLPSPTGSGYYPPPEDNGPHGTRRPRPPEDEPSVRLPPPNPAVYQEEDSRRRSPASMQSNTPPSGYHHSYPRSGEYDAERTSTPRKSSPGPGASGGANMMNLRQLVDQAPPRGPLPDTGRDRDIDQNMLGRLNRRS